jgi:DNA invertase Pin-like site-specific DNA recombinase
MLTVLGRLAEFERESIRSCTSDGRASAVANGVKLGRKCKLSEYQQKEARKRLAGGNETYGQIAKSYNVSRWTAARRSKAF